jgi:hypothetical protein
MIELCEEPLPSQFQASVGAIDAAGYNSAEEKRARWVGNGNDADDETCRGTDLVNGVQMLA